MTTLKTYDTSTGQLLSQDVTYLVRSTVLDQVVSEVSATGAKQQSFVYAGGDLMAIQKVTPNGGQAVEWSTYDASGASHRRVNVNGFNVKSAEMDSFGADAGLFKPITWPTQDAPGKIEPFYGVPELNSATQGCVLDRVPIPCDMLANLKEAGGVVSESLVKDKDGFWRFYRESYESHGLGLFTTKPYQVVELGNGLKPPKPVDLAVLQNSIDTCVTELWPWFDMTSIIPGKPVLDDGGLYPDGHEDDGPALEDCVGRKYYAQMGLTPKSKP